MLAVQPLHAGGQQSGELRAWEEWSSSPLIAQPELTRPDLADLEWNF